MNVPGNEATPFEIRAVLVGPSRVGKTSLMTTLFDGGRRLLGGTRVSLLGQPGTEARLRDCRDALAGTLSGDVFNAGSLGGNAELCRYDFVVNPNVTGAERFRFPLTVLDYPGGWLKPGENEAGKQRVDKFVTEATTLLIPVDATVVMEARERRHEAALPSMLRISDVELVVEHWAKSHPDRGMQPGGTIALCPVKGESYFNDNGGTVDRSEELLERVNRLYLERIREVLVTEEAINRTSILYCPVDTIGPIKLHRVQWHEEGGSFRCAPSYVKRDPAAYRPRTKGAEELFAVLCGDALANTRWYWRQRADEHAERGRAKIGPQVDANARQKMWFYLHGQFGERKDRLRNRTAYAELLGQLDEFDRAVSKIVDCRQRAFRRDLSTGTRFAVMHSPSGE